MKILASPKGRENPYQELLYTAMRAQGDTVRYLAIPTRSATVNMATFLPQLIFWRLCGYNVFHLHWANAFSLQAKIWRKKPLDTFVYWHYVFLLKAITFLGYKLVWTAHNALPHEQAFIDDIAARKKLIAAADLIIAHSPSTIEALKKFGAEPRTFVIIPHGSYIDVYPNTITPQAARENLQLKQDEFVYLYIGQVREYKGVENLLHAYNDLHNANSKLVIAGKCHDSELKKKLAELSRSENIIWHDNYIEDKNLQIYFAAADVVVLPYKKITTSGSALLALSFGKAVIVPCLGDLAQLPDSIAYKYSPEDNHGLANAMKQAADHRADLHRKSEAALRYAKEFNWSHIAKQTRAAIQELG